MYDPRKDQAAKQKQKLQQMLMSAMGGGQNATVTPQSATTLPGLFNMFAPVQPDRGGMGGTIHGNVGNMVTAGIPKAMMPDVLNMLLAGMGGRR